MKGRRRFYKEVTVREKGSELEGQQLARGRRWEVLLDKRVLKTPARKPLEVRNLPSIAAFFFFLL